jgi:hypothetical protein
MPLAKGKSNKAVSKNIQTLVDDYQKSGRIGTSKPANKKAAVKQATAIALQKAGRSKNYAEGGTVSTTSTRTSRTAQPSNSGTSEKAPEYLPLPNQSAPAEDLMPKYRQTRMRMRYTPDVIDVTRPPSAPVRQQDQMKKGGKVSAKKRR